MWRSGCGRCDLRLGVLAGRAIEFPCQVGEAERRLDLLEPKPHTTFGMFDPNSQPTTVGLRIAATDSARPNDREDEEYSLAVRQVSE
jgi:hypothetical protein